MRIVKIVTEDNDVVYFCLYPIYVLGIRIRSRTGKSLNEQKLKFQGIFINLRFLFHEAMRVQLNGCVNVLLMAKDHRRMFDLQLQSATPALAELFATQSKHSPAHRRPADSLGRRFYLVFSCFVVHVESPVALADERRRH